VDGFGNPIILSECYVHKFDDIRFIHRGPTRRLACDLVRFHEADTILIEGLDTNIWHNYPPEGKVIEDWGQVEPGKHYHIVKPRFPIYLQIGEQTEMIYVPASLAKPSALSYLRRYRRFTAPALTPDEDLHEGGTYLVRETAERLAPLPRSICLRIRLEDKVIEMLLDREDPLSDLRKRLAHDPRLTFDWIATKDLSETTDDTIHDLDTLIIRRAHPDFLASPTPEVSEDELNPHFFISLNGAEEEAFPWSSTTAVQTFNEWYERNAIPDGVHMRVNGKRIIDGEPEPNDHIEIWTGPVFQIRFKKQDHQVILRPTSLWADLLEWMQLMGGNLEELRIRKDINEDATEEDFRPDVPLYVTKLPGKIVPWKSAVQEIPPEPLKPEVTELKLIDQWGKQLYNYFETWNERYQKKSTRDLGEKEIRGAANVSGRWYIHDLKNCRSEK
jgi:hypothetical protein